MATHADRLKDAREKFKFLYGAGGKFRKAMKLAYGMYIGGEHQWDSADLDELKAKQRPALSKNIISPKINLLGGLEKQTRTGMQATGVGGEDDPVAVLITGLLKYDNREDRIAKVEARIWKDGNICGVGWGDVGTEMGGDFLRNNTFTREHPSNVMPDPDNIELPQKEWMIMGRQKWYSLDRLKALFPDKLKNINSVESLLDTVQSDKDPSQGTDQSEHGGDYGTEENIYEGQFIDKTRKRVKVIEIFSREFDDIHYIVSNSRNPVVKKIGSDKKEAELRVAQLNNSLSRRTSPTDIRFGLRTVKESRIYVDIFSGRLMLMEHKLDIHNHHEFRLVPYFAYLENMGDGIVHNYGVVFNMMDPQREKNKNHSTFMDIFSRAPLLGGIFKGGRKNKAIIKDMSTVGGWHEGNPADFKEFGGKHLPVLGDLATMEDRNERDADDVSGINKSMLGQMQGAKESGVLARQRVFQGTLGVQDLFENFNTFKVNNSRLRMENMRQFWTAEKMIKAVGQVPGFETNQFMQQAAVLLASDDVMEFDVRLDEGDNSVSAREYAFQSMLQVLQFSKGELPLEAIVESSPWPNKKFILEKIQEQRQNQQVAALQSQQQGASA